jgi:hypothetical protein
MLSPARQDRVLAERQHRHLEKKEGAHGGTMGSPVLSQCVCQFRHFGFGRSLAALPICSCLPLSSILAPTEAALGLAPGVFRNDETRATEEEV